AFVRNYCAEKRRRFWDYQNISFSWSDSENNTEYTVYFADNKAFENAFIVTTAEKELVKTVGIFVPEKTYYWFVCGNDTGHSSAVDTFTVTAPVRYITAGKVTNMRDEGGYITESGRRVKYGMVYRGASLDEHHSYVDDEARNAFHYLKMQSEIELRGEAPHEHTGWDQNSTNVYNVDAHSLQMMYHIGDAQKAQYQTVFNAMADPKNYPFYFHCSAGADRTGTFAYLLHGLLGVPYARMREDYELTSFSEVGLRTADHFADREGSLDEFHERLLNECGPNADVASATEKFLIEQIGISKATVDAIRAIMIEDI
ncbi:MAG: tyrosine-protein phosphatase, partial [Clostridia bacterium]|nr:tyrosine-protein phosphatase [Clostridia bacterium]